ncbi:MAG: hypothetical protein HQL49_12045 [Gammaproteobacteria bacterium]|nr:hypothetical protein [Gammaproteobacteria bacterium]
MPYITVNTNQSLNEASRKSLCQQLSAAVAQLLNKPERYVMVSLMVQQQMLFAGSDDPCAYVELKSIGLPVSRCQNISAALCDLLSSQLTVNSDRIYIEFSDAAANLWGWDRTTF